ncbi:MAG: N-acetylneuraminate synthase family protein [Defluviitaleaceae bacterium]|nr:N-acetylneuraminate synthase family protein [Defluviitaleaceae bacterium]
MTIEIAGRKIGENNPPLIIAEIGINHNGSLDVAKEMVDAACRAGVEIIKHQTHVVDDEMSQEAKKVIPGNANVSIYEIMKSCALNEEDEYNLMKYVESKGMIFLSTPFSRAAADRLHGFGVSAYKIGSGELNHYPLIDHIANFGKPMIISTGMNDIAAINKTVDIVKSKGTPFALLHTTNLYPTPVHLVRLGAMMEMHRAFPNIPFGLSDHTLNNNSSIAAIALGASIIERHFTDTMEREGPDISCSMDEIACAELIRASLEVFKMRGGKKQAVPEEQITINFAFATLVSINPIKKGELFSKNNIWAKRPGTGGLLADEYFNLLGKPALVDIPKDVHLTKKMVGN